MTHPRTPVAATSGYFAGDLRVLFAAAGGDVSVDWSIRLPLLPDALPLGQQSCDGGTWSSLVDRGSHRCSNAGVPVPVNPAASNGGGTSRSPLGRYELRTHPWEVRMSLWVNTPELVDTTSGLRLFAFDDPNWSLEASEWQSESLVVVELRKYPGDHVPALFEVAIDCERELAMIAHDACPLESLERVLDAKQARVKRR